VLPVELDVPLVPEVPLVAPPDVLPVVCASATSDTESENSPPVRAMRERFIVQTSICVSCAYADAAAMRGRPRPKGQRIGGADGSENLLAYGFQIPRIAR
jgi:hypothetical protein